MEDTRTFTSYIARLVALTLALVLFGLAIWFVIQLFKGDDTSEVADDVTVAVIEEDSEGVVVADDDTIGVSYIDTIINEDTTITITSDGVRQSLLAATEEELVEARDTATVSDDEATTVITVATGNDVTESAAAWNSDNVAVLAPTSTELPNTGPGETIFMALALTAVYLSARRYLDSRKLLEAAHL